MSKILASTLFEQQTSEDSALLSGDLGPIYPAAGGAVATFTSFKHSATGSTLTDDEAFAQAVRTLGPQRGTLVIDDGLVIHLTHTVDVQYSMTITSAAGGRDLGSLILGSGPGPLFSIRATATVVGLNLIAQAGSGSIFMLTGTGAAVVDCTMANEAGNSSTMAVLGGAGESLRNDYFSNYEAAAYCWGALEGNGSNSGSSVVGGWAYGPGKGGWIGSTTATTTVSDFTVDGWDCITYGATQIEARAVDNLLITGGTYDQSTQSAFVLGGSACGAHDVTIDGAYISTAGNRASGVAINAAPEGGSGVDGLTVADSDITCAATGIVAGATTTNLVLIGNTINACSTGLNLGGAANTTAAIANQNTAALPDLGHMLGSSFNLQTGWANPTAAASVAYFSGSTPGEAASNMASESPTHLMLSTSAAIQVPQTFLSFKTASDGSTLSDDDAMARAVEWFATNHGTLVIDPGTVIRLSRTVEIPNSMQMVSDGTSDIHFTGGGTCIDITAAGPVLIQGIKLQNEAASGSIIEMGGNTTVLRDVTFRNVLGNTSTMAVFGGPNELIEDCDFVNSEPEAYCWSAPYVNINGQVNINSAVRGGSAVGVGQGGLLGDATASGRVEGFEVQDWNCSTTGATQIECTDVLALHVRGGSYTNAAQAAIALGGGVLGCLSVTVENAVVRGGPGSVAIDAAPSGGVGVTALVVSRNEISGSEIGLKTNIGCGAISVMGNRVDASTVGLEIINTNASALIANNVITAPIALKATVAGAVWASQSYTGNMFSGLLDVEHALPGSYSFVGNTGTTTFQYSTGLTLQPTSPSLVLQTTSRTLNLSGVADANDFVTVESLIDGKRSVVGTVLAGPGGFWVLQTSSMPGGSAEFMATASDVLGNVSACSAPATFTGTGTQASISAGSTNPLFDDSYYVAHYGAEVTASGLAPYEHYVKIGAGERHNPNAWFDTDFYLKQHPDVAASGLNPLLQYEQDGWRDGRATSLLFSGKAYWAANPDTAGTDPLLAYVQSGGAITAPTAYEPGVAGTADVLVQGSYMYGQLRATLVPATAGGAVGWYKSGGWRSMVNPDSMFDTTFYLATHGAEVLASGLDPLTHYETIGWRKGYDPSLLFSTATYLRAHPAASSGSVDPLTMTLQAQLTSSVQFSATAVQPATTVKVDLLLDTASVAKQIATLLPPNGADPTAVAKAYAQGAWHSVTQPNPLFNSAYYLAANPDVTAAGIDPLTHYETSGAAEGRNPDPLFDTSYYLAHNPDVMASGVNPLLHFEQSGWHEGRNPNALFDVGYYLAHNPDVAASGINPLVEFEQAGWYQGRNPDALFDIGYYLSQNKDVAAAGLNPLVHFEQSGWHEGRNPNALFNTTYYLANNPDVAASGVDPLVQFEQTGWQQGRNPDPLFDTSYYLAHNPDVAASGVDPLVQFEQTGWHQYRNPDPLFDTHYYMSQNKDVAAAHMDPLIHFEQSGWHEGRNPSPLFDTKYYLAHNSDVAASGVDPLVEFEEHGWKEGRNPNALFDVKYYLAHNPDVAASGMDPLVHYDEYGWKEGRNPSAAFSTTGYLKANPDVKAAGLDPLAHYLGSGMSEGRAIYPATIT